MKISLKNVFRLVVRFIILLLVAYIFFSLYLQYLAQDHIKNFMSRSLNKDVEFSRIVYRFPLEFQVYDVTIDKFLKMEGMSVRFGKNFLNEKDISIAKLRFVKPLVDLNEILLKSDLSKEPQAVEDQDVIKDIIEATSYSDVEEPLSPQSESVKPLEENDLQYNIHIQNLVITNGHLIYPYEFSGKDILINIDQLMLRAQNFTYPLNKNQTTIEFQGRLGKIMNKFPESQISGEGWVDVLSRDLDGRIRLKNSSQGELLNAHIISENNYVTVKGEINSKDLIKKKKPKEGQSPMEDMAVKALSFLGVDIGIKFYFETKLNDFKISNVSFTGRVGKPASELNQEKIQP